jgi:hypothetical protein
VWRGTLAGRRGAGLEGQEVLERVAALAPGGVHHQYQQLRALHVSQEDVPEAHVPAHEARSGVRGVTVHISVYQS